LLSVREGRGGFALDRPVPREPCATAVAQGCPDSRHCNTDSCVSTTLPCATFAHAHTREAEGVILLVPKLLFGNGSPRNSVAPGTSLCRAPWAKRSFAEVRSQTGVWERGEAYTRPASCSTSRRNGA